MRRATRLAIAAVVLLATSTGVGMAATEFYLDTFETGNYSGSQGTEDWPGPWTEVGSSSAVSVTSSGCTSYCLLIDGGLLGVIPSGARRPADLTEYTAATLSYTLNVQLSLLPLTDAVLRVQAQNGGTWTTLKTHTLATSAGTQAVSVPMSVVAGKSTAVQFIVSGVLGGTTRIDDVRIDLTPAPTTTTSTSTTSTTSTTTTSITVPPTTLPTLPGTTLPGGGGTGSSTTSTTSTTIPGQTSAPTTTNPDGQPVTGGGASGPTASGGGAPSDQPSSGSTVGTIQVEDDSTLIAPIALDVRRDVATGRIEILNAEYQADFSLAAEVFDILGAGPLVLAGVISSLALIGVDRRRRATPVWTDSERQTSDSPGSN